MSAIQVGRDFCRKQAFLFVSLERADKTGCNGKYAFADGNSS
jgi:hypothetical protein